MCAFLRAGANADGGFGYYAGRASRLEATSWVGLALAGVEGQSSAVRRAVDFLRGSQTPDGLIVEPAMRAEDRPNLGFNGIAAMLLATTPDLAGESMSRLLGGIVGHRGIKLPQSPLSPQDNSIQAWAWIDSTFSWVEPTCWCLLGLKKGKANDGEAAVRVKDAERLLRDRACAGGGWNAGTASVLGQGLNAYVPTTALGVLAMQDRGDDPVVRQARAALGALQLTERSSMALSLSLIAATVTAADSAPLRRALLEQWHRTNFLGNLHLTAMAVYGLTDDLHGSAAFRV
jgi:hypothetical protein